MTQPLLYRLGLSVSDLSLPHVVERPGPGCWREQSSQPQLTSEAVIQHSSVLPRHDAVSQAAQSGDGSLISDALDDGLTHHHALGAPERRRSH